MRGKATVQMSKTKGSSGDYDCYVKHCLIVGRPGDSVPMFTQHANGALTPQLENYAIVPLENYRRLLEAAGDDPGQCDW